MSALEDTKVIFQKLNVKIMKGNAQVLMLKFLYYFFITPIYYVNYYRIRT